MCVHARVSHKMFFFMLQPRQIALLNKVVWVGICGLILEPRVHCFNLFWLLITKVPIGTRLPSEGVTQIKGGIFPLKRSGLEVSLLLTSDDLLKNKNASNVPGHLAFRVDSRCSQDDN